MNTNTSRLPIIIFLTLASMLFPQITVFAEQNSETQLFCIGGKSAREGYFHEPNRLAAFRFKESELIRKDGVSCQFKGDDFKNIWPLFEKENRSLEDGDVFYDLDIKIKNKKTRVRIIVLALNFIANWGEEDTVFNRKKKLCGFRGKNEALDMREVAMTGKNACFKFLDSEYFYGVSEFKDGTSASLNCWKKSGKKRCLMVTHFREWEISINNIDDAYKESWKEIRLAVTADLEKRLALYYVGPDNCLGKTCNKFIKGLKQ